MKPKFKVGDEVKVISDVFWINAFFTNKKGVVAKVNNEGSFPYEIKIGDTQIPVYGYEIEILVAEGQQLVFDFIKEE